MAKFERIDLGLKEAYDELFMNDKSRAENKLPKIYNIPIEQIDSFDGHPFKVRDDDEDMIQLVESVKQRGIITPITVREKKDGRYEIISGHRRKRACELAGLETVKAEIKDLTRDEAIILIQLRNTATMRQATEASSSCSKMARLTPKYICATLIITAIV